MENAANAAGIPVPLVDGNGENSLPSMCPQEGSNLLEELGESGGLRARRRNARFTVKDDIKLLRTVIQTMPFKVRHGAKKQAWDDIATIMNREGLVVHGRKCQEHVDGMLTFFAKNDGEMPRKTGTEQEHMEKQQLLLELSEILEEHRLAKQSSGSSMGINQRLAGNDYADSSELGDTDVRFQMERTRTAMERVESSSYYREKRQRQLEDLELKHSMLRLEKEKLDLEREQLQFEKWRYQEDLELRKAERDERRQRLQLDIEERRNFLQLLREKITAQR